MSPTLGLSICAHEVRAVLVTGCSVIWRAVEERAADEDIADTVGRMMGAAPTRRARIGSVSVAVGLCWAQLRKPAGMPAVADIQILSQLLRENSAAFFLTFGGALVVSGVTRRLDGTTWAAAFDEGTVRGVAAAIRERGWNGIRFFPAAQCIALTVPPGRHEWLESDILEVFAVADAGVILEITRRASKRGVDEPARAIANQLAQDDWLYAPAYGAAMAHRRRDFMWRPDVDPRQVMRADRLRTAALSALFAVAIAAAAFGPGARATIMIHRASGISATMRESRGQISRVRDSLRSTSMSLDRLQRFAHRRGEMVRLVGALSQALPESTAVVNLRVDSLEGNIAMLTTHASDVLPQLIDVPGINAPQIAGVVTREILSGVRLERATVRFRRPTARR